MKSNAKSEYCFAAKDPVTPRQVQLLEEFISREMERPFTLVFEVGPVEEVRSSDD